MFDRQNSGPCQTSGGTPTEPGAEPKRQTSADQAKLSSLLRGAPGPQRESLCKVLASSSLQWAESPGAATPWVQKNRGQRMYPYALRRQQHEPTHVGFSAPGCTAMTGRHRVNGPMTVRRTRPQHPSVGQIDLNFAPAGCTTTSAVPLLDPSASRLYQSDQPQSEVDRLISEATPASVLS